MAWRRDSMGEAKSWCCGKFPNFLAENNRLSTFYKVLIIILVPVSDLVQSGFRLASRLAVKDDDNKPADKRD